ncbi:MAG TPA: hypothetical protein VNQ77_10540, partial [Frankiaceae bacterium]|nr:hypothetical protein [Frankiaceae bacterium]
HAELRLGMDLPIGRKRVARLMRRAGLCGIGGARKTRRRNPNPAVHDDTKRYTPPPNQRHHHPHPTCPENRVRLPN